MIALSIFAFIVSVAAMIRLANLNDKVNTIDNDLRQLERRMIALFGYDDADDGEDDEEVFGGSREW